MDGRFEVGIREYRMASNSLQIFRNLSLEWAKSGMQTRKRADPDISMNQVQKCP